MFRFTIRDVLLATVIVGLSVGWLLDHWRLMSSAHIWESRADVLVEHLDRNGAEVKWTPTRVVIREQSAGVMVYVLPVEK